MRGNPETHREALQEERRTGATQGFTEGSVDRMQDSGQLEAASPASRRCRSRGNPETHRKAEKGVYGPSNLRVLHT